MAARPRADRRVTRTMTALAVLVAAATLGHAAPRDDYFERLVGAVRSGLDRAIAARTPVVQPPVPIQLVWKATRLGSLDLGAPLLAMTAGDLDGNGRGELYAVTSRELVAITLDDRKLATRARVAFGGEPAVPAPRDPVGTIVIDGAEVVAAASPWARELRGSWQGAPGRRAFDAREGEAGFLMCPGERATLVPGRNHFGDPTAPQYGVRCRADLVDPQGYPLRVRAALVDATLQISVARCSPIGTACEPVGAYEYKDYGVAFELADLDRDGTPEVIVTGAGAPGDRDAVKVIELGGDDRKGMFRYAFNGGVVAVAVIDSDGDGASELVAAVRLPGSTRVDLWRFN